MTENRFGNVLTAEEIGTRQMRLDVSTKLLAGMLACPKDYGDDASMGERVARAISYADELLYQLTFELHRTARDRRGL